MLDSHQVNDRSFCGSVFESSPRGAGFWSEVSPTSSTWSWQKKVLYGPASRTIQWAFISPRLPIQCERWGRVFEWRVYVWRCSNFCNVFIARLNEMRSVSSPTLQPRCYLPTSRGAAIQLAPGCGLCIHLAKKLERWMRMRRFFWEVCLVLCDVL